MPSAVWRVPGNRLRSPASIPAICFFAVASSGNHLHGVSPTQRGQGLRHGMPGSAVEDFLLLDIDCSSSQAVAQSVHVTAVQTRTNRQGEGAGAGGECARNTERARATARASVGIITGAGSRCSADSATEGTEGECGPQTKRTASTGTRRDAVCGAG